MFIDGKVDNNYYEGEGNGGQDDQCQGSFHSVAPQTAVLSGLGALLLRSKYLGQAGGQRGHFYLCSAAADTNKVIEPQIPTTARRFSGALDQLGLDKYKVSTL